MTGKVKRSKVFKRSAGLWVANVGNNTFDDRNIPICDFEIPDEANEIHLVSQPRATKHSTTIFMMRNGVFVDTGHDEKCKSLPWIGPEVLPGWGLKEMEPKKFHVEIEYE